MNEFIFFPFDKHVGNPLITGNRTDYHGSTISFCVSERTG